MAVTSHGAPLSIAAYERPLARWRVPGMELRMSSDPDVISPPVDSDSGGCYVAHERTAMAGTSIGRAAPTGSCPCFCITSACSATVSPPTTGWASARRGHSVALPQARGAAVIAEGGLRHHEDGPDPQDTPDTGSNLWSRARIERLLAFEVRAPKSPA